MDRLFRWKSHKAHDVSPTGEVAGRCSSDEAAENRNYLIDPFEYSSNERFHEIAPLHVLLRDSTAHPFCREIIRATGGNWGLDNVSSATLRPFNSDINTPRIDSYRFSMANLEGKKPVGGDVTIVRR
ncbi:RAPH1 protein [Vespula maculifrons]|uniref:RAPH1 protein n=1 Tax=Vespula maculifrons TaxID=7453 RepID=A0ABD2ARF3_VESMC